MDTAGSEEKKQSKSNARTLIGIALIVIVGIIIATCIVMAMKRYSFTEIDGEKVVCDNLTGTTFYPDTRTAIPFSYAKDEDIPILTGSSIIPVEGSPGYNLIVDAKVKIIGDTVLYILSTSYTGSSTISPSDQESYLNALRNYGTGHFLLEIYDADGFSLLERNIPVTGGMGIVDSSGIIEQLQYSGSFTIDANLLSHAKTIDIGWAGIKMYAKTYAFSGDIPIKNRNQSVAIDGNVNVKGDTMSITGNLTFKGEGIDSQKQDAYLTKLAYSWNGFTVSLTNAEGKTLDSCAISAVDFQRIVDSYGNCVMLNFTKEKIVDPDAISFGNSAQISWGTISPTMYE